MRELLRHRWGVYVVVACVALMWLWPRHVAVTQQQPCATCPPAAALASEVALWAGRWEEALQTGRGVLPADLSFPLELPAGATELHVTSFHFWRGGALGNWAAWLREAAPGSTLVAFVASADAARVAAAVPGVRVVEAGALLEPFVLCQRDPGSGIKVRAVLELLRRGHDVWYSDADVVWRRAPRLLPVAPDADVALQIYGAGAGVAQGRFGLNMGLFWARSSARLQAVLRRLLRAMTRSFAVRPDGGLDTCNDQNCLNGLLMRWQPQLVCGWHFRGVYYPREGADRAACVVLQLLDPAAVRTAAELLGPEGPEWGEAAALHMTGYAGGHTLAKAFAMREWGLWRGPLAPLAPATQFLELWPEQPMSLGHLRGGLLLALLSSRALVLPRRMACAARRAGCTLESQVRLDRLLLCDRALRGEAGYGDAPDRLPCAGCARFEGRMPGGWFVLPDEYQGSAKTAVSHQKLRPDGSKAVQLTGTPPPADDHPMISWCLEMRDK